MKILVTGIAGFIGSHLAERLLSLGHEVVGIDNYNSYYSPEIKKLNSKAVKEKGAEIYELDIAEDDLSEAVNGVEIVYHLAAQPGISKKVDFKTYVRNNIKATYNLVEALKTSDNLKLFVNCATSSVYGFHARDNELTPPKPASYYGVTKLAAEQLVLAYQRDADFPGCSFRLFNVIGPRERPEKLFPLIIRSMFEDDFEFTYYEGAEKHIRSYTYVGDIVDGLILAMENSEKCVGEIFNLGTDKTVTSQEALEILEEIVGKKAKFKKGPGPAGDQKETRADITKAREVLGYDPQTTQREALEDFAKWYIEEINGKIKYIN